MAAQRTQLHISFHFCVFALMPTRQTMLEIGLCTWQRVKAMPPPWRCCCSTERLWTRHGAQHIAQRQPNIFAWTDGSVSSCSCLLLLLLLLLFILRLLRRHLFSMFLRLFLFVFGFLTFSVFLFGVIMFAYKGF